MKEIVEHYLTFYLSVKAAGLRGGEWSTRVEGRRMASREDHHSPLNPTQSPGRWPHHLLIIGNRRPRRERPATKGERTCPSLDAGAAGMLTLGGVVRDHPHVI